MASRLVIGIFALIALSACSGARQRRLQERDKLAAATGMYCDFVNGDEFQDVEVELNLQMAKRCDAGRNFSLSGYKNSSDVHGLVYCCSMPKKEDKALDLKTVIEKSAAEKKKSEAPRAEAPKPENLKPELPKLDQKLEPKADGTKDDSLFDAPAPEIPSAPSGPSSSPSGPSAPEAKPSASSQPAASNETLKRAPKTRAPASKPLSKPASPQKLDPSDLDAILEN